ncbi:proline-, glutamic acid- and leucine-rich protein 1 [Brachypodium distachyon]|uniref:Uncharacterized protein n=1 Tax=Brachypodium distachyon TaxID=15368 RepID=I1HCL9_BRADI|nr:proline-, glutamic acid- and leucine-rich protein 1 [Brachypodium distachyon]KQK03003.1 hypothetical protein BRADI_2g04940v3 [Brachypodium distachyon]|eukprot:XP_003565422.1 proline-, glutamic acid- and leucine-rich protein 1 [Brachypodium distachyon]
MAHFAGSPAPAGDAFWTACPHCCYVHSYPRVYVGRRLRCPTATCRRAFSAAELPSPPPIVPGTDMYFCTWAFFPLGPATPAEGWAPFTPFNPAPPSSPSPSPTPPAAGTASASAPTRVRPTSRKKVGVCLKGRARVEAEEEEDEEEQAATDDIKAEFEEEEVQADWLSLGGDNNGGSGLNINEAVDLSELGFCVDESGFLQELP